MVTLHFIDGGRGDADGVANGTILDPGGPNSPIGGGGGGSQAVLQFSSATYAVFEDAGAATITVVRTGDTSGAASVHYATSDGTATQPADYAAATGTLNFAANEISKTFSVNVVNDGVTESPETVHLTLSNPTGATIGTPNPADLTISDPFSNGSIGDRVWTDRNCNGLQDAGEPGRSGVSLQLLKNGVEVATTTSGADGSYSFTSLSAGTYVVQAYAPPDYQFTTQNVGSDRTIDSNGNPDGTSGEIVIDAAHPSDNTIDFGLVSTARIGDFVWVDQNVNGLQDAGEPGLPGVSVHLLTAAGTELYSTVTDANGKYAFGDLVAEALTRFDSISPLSITSAKSTLAAAATRPRIATPTVRDLRIASWRWPI